MTESMFVTHVYPTLINLVFAGSLVSALAWIASLPAFNQNPKVRYSICWIAITLLIASPIICVAAGQLRIGVIQIANFEPADGNLATKKQKHLSMPHSDVEVFPPVEWMAEKSESTTANNSPALGSSFGDDTAETFLSHTLLASENADYSVLQSELKLSSNGILRCLYCVIAVWVVGSCWQLLQMAIGVRAVQRLRRFARDTSDSQLNQIFGNVKKLSGSRPVCRIVETSLVPSPLTIGICRPTIVMPKGISKKLSRTQLVSVLLHELAHVIRKDTLAAFMQQIASILYWWNPFVWMLNRNMSRIRELLCDDWVILKVGSGDALAEAVVYLAEFTSLERNRPPKHALSLFGSESEIELRVGRLLDGLVTRNYYLSKKSRANVVCTGIFLLLLFGTPFFFVPLASSSLLAAAQISPPPNNATEVVAENVKPKTITPIRAEDVVPLPRNILLRIGNSPMQHSNDTIRFIRAQKDGTQGLTSSSDHVLRLWDFESGKLIRTFNEPEGSQLRGFDFSPNGTAIVAAISDRGRISLWDIRTGESLLDHPIRQSSSLLSGITILQNLKKLVTMGPGRIYIRDLASLNNSVSTTQTMEFTDGEESATQILAKAPDESRIALAIHRDVYLIDPTNLNKNEVLRNVCERQIDSLEFTADSRNLLVNGTREEIVTENGKRKSYLKPQVSLWKVDNQSKVIEYKFEPPYLHKISCSISPDGSTIATMYRGELRILSAKTGMLLREPIIISETEKGWSETLAFLPDGKHVAVSNRGKLRIIDLDTGFDRFDQGPSHSSAIRAIAITRDKTHLLTSGGSEIKVWSRKTGELVHNLELPRSNHGYSVQSHTLRVDDDKKQVSVEAREFGKDSPSTYSWNIISGELVEFSEKQAEQPSWVFENSSGSINVFTTGNQFDKPFSGGSKSTSNRVVFTASDELPQEMPLAGAPIGAVHAAYYDRTQNTIRVFDSNGILHSWSIGNRSVQRSQPIKPGPNSHGYQNVMFSKDGKLLVVQESFSNLIYMINPESGREFYRQQHEGTRGSYLALSSDGSKLASAGHEMFSTQTVIAKNILIWDTKTWQVLREFLLPSAFVTSLTFSDDGKELVTGHSDSTVLVWNTDVSAQP